MSNVVTFAAYRNRKLAQQGEAFKSTVACAGCGKLTVFPEVATGLLIGTCIPCKHTVPIGVVR